MEYLCEADFFGSNEESLTLLPIFALFAEKGNGKPQDGRGNGKHKIKGSLFRKKQEKETGKLNAQKQPKKPLKWPWSK